jgi:phage minor structural protein
MRFTIWAVTIDNVPSAIIQPTSEGVKDGVKIYDTDWNTNEQQPKLDSCEFEDRVNAIATLSFTINAKNPNYSHVLDRNTMVFVFNEDNNVNQREYIPYDVENPGAHDPYCGHEVVFAGNIVTCTESISREGIRQKEVKCASWLDWLNQRIIPRMTYTNENGAYANFQSFIALYAGNMGDDNGFKGNIYTIRKNLTDVTNAYEYIINYEPVYTALMQRFIDNFGWEISAKCVFDETTFYFVIYLSDRIGADNKDFIISEGFNLLNITVEKNEEDVVTRLYPLGVSDGDGKYLTIESVNVDPAGGMIPYIEDATLKEKYGILSRVEIWDDVTIASKLKSKAQKWLNDWNGVEYRMDLSAVENDCDLVVGNSYRVECMTLGISRDKWRVVKIRRDLISPWNTTIELGSVKLSREQQQIIEQTMINSQISTLYRTKETK